MFEIIIMPVVPVGCIPLMPLTLARRFKAIMHKLKKAIILTIIAALLLVLSFM